MNKKIFNPVSMAAIMALAACTNDEMQPSINDSLTLGNSGNIVRISLSDAMGTRAARPINSSESTNNINRIAFRLVRSDKSEQQVTLKGIISGEDTIIDCVDKNVLKLDNHSGDINVLFEDLPKKKDSFKIIAYGYNYDEKLGDEKDEFPYSIAISDGSGDLSFKCIGVTTVQEIFAGTNVGNPAYIPVNQHGKFDRPVSITLRRQVAGLMAYFVEAPAYVYNQKVEKITVSSKANVTGFYIPEILHNEDENGDGYGTGYNGVDDAGWNALDRWVNHLTFDMSKATNYGTNEHDQPSNGETYEFNDSYLLAEETTNIDKEHFVCEENSLFGSCFLIPFPGSSDFGVGGCATLNICYWGGDNKDELIESIPLRNGGSAEDNIHADSYQYGIKCNNFYSIGIKTDAEEYISDNPISIDEPTGYNNMTVEINSEWVINDEFFN